MKFYLPIMTKLAKKQRKQDYSSRIFDASNISVQEATCVVPAG